jgi:hypothetical protein
MTKNTLIKEGRREDILTKDPEQFRVPSEQEVDTPFHKKTNYKYLNWVFDQYNKNEDYSFEELSNIVERFDKISKNLIKKDINQYKDLDELLNIFKFYGSTKEEKKSGKKVLLDTDDFLVIRPLTREASCYYGANTKWCTSATAEGKNKFEQYASTGKLYYIISRKPLDMKNWNKVAIYVDDYYGGEVFYDNLDVTMNKQQSEDYLSFLDSDVIESIRNDYSSDENQDKWRNLKNVLYNYPYVKFKSNGHVIGMWGENDKLNFIIDDDEFFGIVDGNKVVFYSQDKPIVEEIKIDNFLRSDLAQDAGISFKNLVYLSFVNFLVSFIKKIY